MRTTATICLVILCIALVACIRLSRRSTKPVAHEVRLLLVSLLAPMLGNLLIIASSDWLIAQVGCYIYYTGIDLTMVALLRFTTSYCQIPYLHSSIRRIILTLVVIDIIQLLSNPLLGHAFTTAQTMVEGTVYYALVPFLGQTLHRVFVYLIFISCIIILAYKTFSSPLVYLDRYLVIFIAMVAGGAWETYYVVSGSPIDLSMFGYGVFGILCYLFTLRYRPMILMNGILARVVSDMNEAVFFFDRDSACIYANTAGKALFEISSTEELGKSNRELEIIIGDGQYAPLYEWTRRLQVGIDQTGHAHPIDQKPFDLTSEYPLPLIEVAEQSASAGDATSQTKHFTVGEPEPSWECRFWQLNHHVMHDKKNARVGSFLIVHDRTLEERRLRRERTAAERDELTGLYNARYLYNQAERMISSHPGTSYYAIAIDVRQFKLINDIFSKDYGDYVLRAIADKIRAMATPNEVYGRISGDKFGFVLPADELNVQALKQSLLNDDFSHERINYPIIVHMGLYEVIDKSIPVSVMFDRAFMAITSIKHDFSQRIVFYDEEMRQNAIWNQRIAAELDDAIMNGEIQPYLQPLVNHEGKVEGAEILVRWIHPEEGFLPPVRFIPFFEDSGRIAQLDVFIWECACQILSDWQQRGIDLFLSVNISPKDFFFIDVHDTITSLVKKYDVDPYLLRLEITETVMMNDVANRLHVIESLRDEGFLVEMDDFGSGYSSLNLLKDMPVDVLKIDMVFLYETRDQQRAETILQTIINLSAQLGMPSITEGVETAEQLTMLTNMGCQLFQGHYFAKPMPLDEFLETYCPAA